MLKRFLLALLLAAAVVGVAPGCSILFDIEDDDEPDRTVIVRDRHHRAHRHHTHDRHCGHR
jgi:hypothetical protein